MIVYVVYYVLAGIVGLGFYFTGAASRSSGIQKDDPSERRTGTVIMFLGLLTVSLVVLGLVYVARTAGA